MKPAFSSWWLLVCALAVATVNTSYAYKFNVDSLHQKVAHGSDSEQVSAHYSLALHYKNISIDSAIYFSEKTVALAKKINWKKQEAEAYSLLGVADKNQGNYEAAIKWHLKSLALKEAIKDENGMCITYNDLGVVYKSMKRWDEALVNYRKANELGKKLKLRRSESMTYNNIGTVYLGKEMPDSAYYYYKLAYDVAVAANIPDAKITALANLGEVYTMRKEYDKAEDVLLQCLDFDKGNDDKYGMSLSYFQMARLYTEMALYNKARLYADSSEKIAIAEGMTIVLKDILEVRADLEERSGNYKSATDYLKRSRTLNDSLTGASTNDKISELQTKYETGKKEQQIKLQQAEINNRNYVIAGLAVSFALVALLGYSYYNRYKLRQQAHLQQERLKQQEASTLAVLEAEERERKRIATDLHDGVGQMMSAARMNLSVLGNEIALPEQIEVFNKAMKLVDESCKEVRQVSHNIMPNTLTKKGLVFAVNEFINTIDKRALDINLYADNMETRLPLEVEIMLYRAIQECINNVIKHSGAKGVNISLVRDEAEISITIEDNGKGFDTAALHADKGIGLKNIETRIQYLKGDVSWDSAPGKGTVVMIHIPAFTYTRQNAAVAYN